MNSNTNLTIEKAKELSIKKWEWIIKHRKVSLYVMEQEIPELKELQNGCGYCELFLEKNCRGCPININNIIRVGFFNGCVSENHPFFIWYNNRTTKSAKTVLELIKNK